MVSRTSEISLSRNLIKQAAGGTIYNRGLDYFKSDKVIEHREITPGVIEGLVRGRGVNRYSTRIDFTDGRFFSSCSCPYIWSDVCKHAVALALEYLHQKDLQSRQKDLRQSSDRHQASDSQQPSNPQEAQLISYSSLINRSINNEKAEPTECDTWEAIEYLIHESEQSEAAATHSEHRIRRVEEYDGEYTAIENIAWRQILDQLVATRKPADNTGVQRVIYRLELDGNRLVLQTKKARIGKRGKGKEYPFYYDRSSFNSFLHHKDNAIFGLLLRSSLYCYSYSHRISSDIIDPLFRLLHDEEYVFSGDSETKADISSVPVSATLVLREDGENHVLEVSLSTKESGLSGLPVILGENRPWITDGRTFRPLETRIPGSILAELLQQPQIIGRAQIDLFMNSYYDSLAQNASIDIRSTLIDSAYDDMPVKPVIHLEAENGALLVKPCFAYGEGPPQVEPGNKSRIVSATVDDKSVWVKRQLDIEQDVFRQLEAGGVKFDDNRNDQVGRLQGDTALDFLFNEAPRLQAQGCEVVSEASSLHINRSAPKISATVSSGIDWFDLGFAFDYGKTTADLPAVLAAYRSGKRYIKLDDGNWGALPIEWLNKSNAIFDELAELDKGPRDKGAGSKSSGSESDGTVRARSHHIPLIEDLVSGIDLQSDLQSDTQSSMQSIVKLDRLRQRLASFDGLEKVEVPERLNTTLRDYQHKGLDWLEFLSSCSFSGILADDMGLGKTVQTLAHLLHRKQSRREKSSVRPSLIIAPTSVAHNWRDEAERFAPDLNAMILTDPDRHKDFNKIPDADIVITTYALLRRDFETLKTYTYDYIILDEAQYIKNPAAQTSRLCKTLAASHRLALTGTPIENNLTELWSIFDFLMPGFLSSHKNFRERYEKPIAKAAKAKTEKVDAERPVETAKKCFGDKTNDTGNNNANNASMHKSFEGNDGRNKAEEGTEALERLKKRVKPFILRRLKQQVASELPPKSEVVSYCEMTSAQEHLYRQVLNTYRAKVFEAVSINGVERSHITILDALLKLRQVCNHPQLLKLSSNSVKSSGKMDMLKEMIEQLVSENHKALVFSQFTQMLGLVKKWLDEHEIPYCYLDGSSRNRHDIIERFNSGNAQLFLISLKAGGTGLNLTAADYVIHIDPWWNPAIENQATDRAHRIGKNKHVFVYKLITKNSIEEKILKLQNNKKALVDNLLSDGVIGKSLTKEDLDDLFSI